MAWLTRIQLTGMAVTVILIMAVHYGSGQHWWLVKDEYLSTLSMLNRLANPVASYAFLTSKLSVGVTLLRLGFGRTFQILVCCIMVLAAVFNVWPSIGQLVGCNAWKYAGNLGIKCTPGAELGLATLLYIQSGASHSIKPSSIFGED